MKAAKGLGTTRGFAWAISGRLVNWTTELGMRKKPAIGDQSTTADPMAPTPNSTPVAVRVITEGEFQRLVKRAIRNDTYDLFQRRRKPNA